MRVSIGKFMKMPGDRVYFESNTACTVELSILGHSGPLVAGGESAHQWEAPGKDAVDETIHLEPGVPVEAKEVTAESGGSIWKYKITCPKEPTVDAVDASESWVDMSWNTKSQ